jgi:predicted transcriptional regulator of viral defense system
LRTEYNGHLKTLGPQAANLVITLYERGRMLFTLKDVREITGKKKNVRQFVDKLVRRGVATRLKPGVFILVPYELGRERQYLGNPYIVARELMGSKQYFISHGSAMDLHEMVTQPQLVVYVTSPMPVRKRTILGTEFRFIRLKPSLFFGTLDHWVDKQEKVVVSDIERTILDGLRQPEYCGGVTEVFKGFMMRRRDVNIGSLVDYALRLDIGAVIRRLGFLLELYEVDAPAEIRLLCSHVTPTTYPRLDPTLPKEGSYNSRWRLQLNVSPEELLVAPTT